MKLFLPCILNKIPLWAEWTAWVFSIIGGISSILSLITIFFAYKKFITNKLNKRTFQIRANIGSPEYKNGRNFYQIAFNFSIKNKTDKEFYIYSISPIINNHKHKFYIETFNNEYKPFSPISVKPFQEFSIDGFVKANFDTCLPNEFLIQIRTTNRDFNCFVKDYTPKKDILLSLKSFRKKD